MCPECNGEGKTIDTKCSVCGGEGIVKKDEIVSFHIPAGVTDGMTLKMTGQGNAARHGGVNGDLLVVIEEEKDPNLIRDEDDLIYNLMLDFPTAALGGSVEVPLVEGKARLKIPAGTQPGQGATSAWQGIASLRLGQPWRRARERDGLCAREPFRRGAQGRGEPARPAQLSPPRRARYTCIFSKLRHIFHKEGDQ